MDPCLHAPAVQAPDADSFDMTPLMNRSPGKAASDSPPTSPFDFHFEPLHLHPLAASQGENLVDNAADQDLSPPASPPSLPEAFFPSHFKPIAGASCFVFHLPAHFDNSNLRDLFNLAAVVQNAHVAHHRETGKSKGYGFVDFASKQDANRAVNMFHEKFVDGKKLHVAIKGTQRHGVLL